MVGFSAGFTQTLGGYNTFVGSYCGYGVTTGQENTFYGYQAGHHGVSTTTGNYNVFIGQYAHGSSATQSQEISLGHNVACTGNQNFTFGYGTTDSNISFGGTSITAPSDVRLKENIEDEKIGLDFINELRPVTFQWKKANEVPSEMRVYDADSEERVMNGKYNHGFIAQEVKEVIDRYDFKEGFDMWTEDAHDGGRQRIGDASLMPLMVKAVQELSAKVDDLTEKLDKCNCE
jgi:hypothetical protein